MAFFWSKFWKGELDGIGQVIFIPSLKFSKANFTSIYWLLFNFDILKIAYFSFISPLCITIKTCLGGLYYL